MFSAISGDFIDEPARQEAPIISSEVAEQARADDGSAVYVSGENAVYALRASDGKILWHRGKTQGCDNGACTNVAMAATGGKVFVFFPDGLYALRAVDGTILWRNPVFRFTTRSFVLLNDKLYVPGDGRLYIAQTTSHVASIQIVGQPQPTVTPSGYSTDVYALNASDGSILWHWQPTNASGGSTDVAAGDGNMYVAIGDSLYALRGSDGKVLWKVLQGERLSSPVIG